MRFMFTLCALVIGVGATACGAAAPGDGVAEESAQTASSSTATEKTAPSEATEKATATESSAYVSCNNYWACIRACVRRDPRGVTGCDGWCDDHYPQCNR
jgi:hypothetical protein